MAPHFNPDYQTALRLQERGHALEALPHYRGLAERLMANGGDIRPVLDISGRLCQLHDFTPALTLCRSFAGRCAPVDLVRMALLWRQEYQFASAAGFAAMVPDSAASGASLLDAQLILAECAERLGRTGQALVMSDRLVATHPGSLPARRLRASLLRRMGRAEEALACLAPLARLGARPHWETCRAWFELGHIEDALGHYESAWKAWTTARLHYPPGADWNLYRDQASHVWSQVKALHDSVTADAMRKWRRDPAPADGGTSSGAPAILTGHPRSGTTLLEQSLEALPGVESVEESTIFTAGIYRPLFQYGPVSTDPAARLSSLTPAERAHWRREYSGLMSLALEGRPTPRILLDKNPDLLQLLPAFVRIFPEVRIIVMERDPRDILVSMYSQALPPNHTSWSYRTPEASAGMISLRLGLWHGLRQKLPEETHHTIRYESAMNDYAATVSNAAGFLGLDQSRPRQDGGAEGEIAGADRRKSENARVVHSPTYAAVREPVHTRAIGRWRHYEKWIGSSLGTLGDVVEKLGYD